MKVPYKISPNPLISVVFELRYNSTLQADEVLQVIYPLLIEEFPKISNNKRWILAKNDPEYNYLPEYTFLDDSYSISVGESALVFGINDAYFSWEEYSNKLISVLTKIDNLGVIQKLKRVGLRFINIFEEEVELAKILKKNFLVGDDKYNSEGLSFNSVFEKNGVKMLFKFHEKAKVSSKNKEGVYIDIDAAIDENLDSFSSLLSSKLIDKLHKEEKELFFYILKSSFLETLNPEYRDY